jgi:hypothetical protein
MIKMTGPQGTTEVHHDGLVFRPDKKGVFEVAEALAEILKGHGFVPWTPPAKEEPTQVEK